MDIAEYALLFPPKVQNTGKAVFPTAVDFWRITAKKFIWEIFIIRETQILISAFLA